jgi:CheY-like chemotaxis protein
MKPYKLKILVVDDEVDVIETIKELLPYCDITDATNYNQAKELIIKNEYDMAILDVMGVNGFELLRETNNKEILAIILTAHAFDIENTKKAYFQNAAYFVPKDKLGNISDYVDDVLNNKKDGKSRWEKWLNRFGKFYDKRFGLDWREKEKDFLNKLKYTI